MMMKDSVLVIGGGIAGIQASLDLAEKGLNVYLVEKSPSIGGRMAQLDKTFPTNDCSICILAPKMIDCFNHPNITVYSYSQVKKMSRSGDSFQVQITTKPRYIDEDKCTGCGDCITACPYPVQDIFNVGLGSCRSIHLYFPQAVPRVALIDWDTCNRCGNCVKVCNAEAINLNQESREFSLDVQAIIVAIGLDVFDPSSIPEYGYGEYPNVITSIQYERLINASGPTGGHLVRLSDGRPVKRLAFIQCVGSRDVKNNPYCSAICCMFSTKSATLAREHNPDIENFIFYTELQASGKRFQEYIVRGKAEYGIQYIQAKPGEIREDADNNPVLWYYDRQSSEVKKITVDMVVLAVALQPSHGAGELAGILGIDIDENGFFLCRDMLFAPSDTNVPGIFICGYNKRPMDITDAVIDASGASARAAEYISASSGNRSPIHVQTTAKYQRAGLDHE
jgi:heterodisulfide reductase subunit A